jgi:hypothetical protein
MEQSGWPGGQRVSASQQYVIISSSVAAAQADAFSKNGYTVPNKIVKILKIFDWLETLKSRGVILWY